jgi:hypothetical protein
MSVELREEADGKILVIALSGKLTKHDYERFVPHVAQLIGEHGKLRILCELNDFHGWKAGALWEDIKFDFKHFADIERLAFIGNKAWELGMSVFCHPFTTASVRYFDESQAEEARKWIHGDLPITATGL